MKIYILSTFLAATTDGFQRAPGNGPCRGPGGVLDKVNNRGADEISETECRAYCEAEPNCNGFGHTAAINEGECILHGPGLDGTCSDPTLKGRYSCEDAGKTWTPPPAPWVGESWHSTIVAGTTDEVSSDYVCYELDDEDHLAHCRGDSCAFSGNRTADNCPTGCTFTAAPEMPPAKPPHPGDIGLPGWPKPISGACRGGPDNTDKVNGLYANINSQTQEQCAEKCLSLAPDCTGYHHGPYCSVFGANIHLKEDPEGDDKVWYATAGNETVITGTKANPGYICFTDVPSSAFYLGTANIIVVTAAIFSLWSSLN